MILASTNYYTCEVVTDIDQCIEALENYLQTLPNGRESDEEREAVNDLLSEIEDLNN